MNSIKRPRVGCLENLECLLSPERDSFFYGVISGGPLEPLIRASCKRVETLPVRHRDPFFLDDRTVFSKTPGLAWYKEQGIEELIVGAVPNRTVEKRAQAHGIRLLSNSSAMQDVYEDKAVIHRLLMKAGIPVPEGGIVKKESEIPSLKSGLYPVVVQIPDSYGGFGTFYANDPKEVRAIIKRQAMPFPVLVRRKVPGIAVGVTILIGKKRSIVSAMRYQICMDTDGPKRYFGVQWVPTAKQPEAFQHSFLGIVENLTSVLRGEGFCGIANFDMIVGPEGVFVLECNPRLSGATWQLAARPELLHGRSFMKEYISLMRTGDPTVSRVGLPESDYEGSTLDLDAYLPILPSFKKRGPSPAALYACKGKALQMVSQNVADFNEDTFLLMPNTARLPTTTGEGLGIVLSHTALYQVKGLYGALNFSAKGRWLWKNAPGVAL